MWSWSWYGYGRRLITRIDQELRLHTITVEPKKLVLKARILHLGTPNESDAEPQFLRLLLLSVLTVTALLTRLFNGNGARLKSARVIRVRVTEIVVLLKVRRCTWTVWPKDFSTKNVATLEMG
jgi:hypothetical protein